ncbi:MAG: ACT domain-containing protein [Desulfurococcaceae archaeon]
MSKAPISELVRSILEISPCIVESIEKGYANYTRLANLITEIIRSRYNTSCNPEAVKMAILRTRNRIHLYPQFRKIMEILASTSIEVKTNLVILTYDVTLFKDIARLASELAGKTRFLSITQSVGNITIITNMEIYDYIKKNIKAEPLLDIMDVSALILVSPPENIKTPGFIAYITMILAQQGINIIQIVSAHNDTILVIDKQDAARAFNIVERLIEESERAVDRTRVKHEK